MDSWNIVLSVLLGAIGFGYIGLWKKANARHDLGFWNSALHLPVFRFQQKS